MHTLSMLEAAARDARYALRTFRKSPLFTGAAVLTLAIAIGVNTAVFSVVDAVLLRPLPYPDADRLALVSRIVRAGGADHASPAVDGRTWHAVRDRAASVRSAVFSTWTSGVNLVVASAVGPGQARYVQQQRVGSGFFDTLGVRPALGREFTADEDRASGPAAAILSAGLWRTLFAADPDVIGRSVVLKGAPAIVVGVMPDGFQTGQAADLWSPLRASTSGEGAGENYHVLLRLKEGSTWTQTSSELARIGDELRREQRASEPAEIWFSLVPLQQGLTEPLRQPLMMLWGAVAIVLLVACVNLAGLLLARGSRRTREIATRMALGSGRAAVIRQLFVESLVLAALGGVAGLLLGIFALDALTRLARGAYEIWQPVGLDSRSLAAGCALSLLASLGFGLVPAVQTARVDVRAGLLADSRTVSAHASRWPRRILVVAQVALGTVLLVSAGLLLRTYSHLSRLNPGFDPRNVVTAAVSLEDDRYATRAHVVQLFDRTLDEMARTRGVEAAAVALELPYRRLLNLGFRHLDGPGARDGRGATTSAAYISPGFFDAMRIPVRHGRTFTPADRDGTAPVAIVSDGFVRMYFQGEDPVGRRIAIAGAQREIVGQVGDVQVRPGWGDYGPLAAMPLVYVPVGQVTDGFLRLVHGWFAPTFIVRSSAGAAETAAGMRRALDRVDPLLPFASVRPMADVKDVSLAPQRFLMALIAGLAAVAVILAAVGIHGLIATSIADRTREIGIRIALGASPGRVVRATAMPGIVLSLAGIALGVLGSLAAIRLLRSLIWGISATDPTTFVAVAVMLLTVAALASLLPALRILRLDPSVALRNI
jgi:predicted permease